ncbi:MAG: HAMP domain-containing protein [Solirubrobacterales bacterium]|nr:HAMP domain-containing protein [Solirubrobacterales bacterium]
MVELGASLVIAVIAVALMLNYFPGVSTGRVIAVLAVTSGAVAIGVLIAQWRAFRHLGPVYAWWDARAPDTELSVSAWDAATNHTKRSFQANSMWVALITLVPTVVFTTIELRQHWWAGVVIAVSGLVPFAYGTAISYAAGELLLRPVVADIAAKLPVAFDFQANGLLVRKRLKLMLPIFTSFVGFVVAALMSRGRGATGLIEGTAAAFGVGILFSFELTVLMGRSVTGPIAELRRGVGRIASGDYATRVPVLTSDELGELSHDFNQMAVGLAEREQMRDAFGTYVDREVVPLILSGRYPQDGVEVNVSILFLDVWGFTEFSEGASAPEVVRALNDLFETVVPIIAAHGGHIDKFLGDGVLAVFGMPEGYADHADRALGAAIELAQTVNRDDRSFRVGVGINTGSVVAGSIGGAGRLNFSVIGDAVNTAARVEAATRSTGDGVLVTAATRDALTRPAELIPRDTVAAKGKREPVTVFAVPGLEADFDAESSELASGSQAPGGVQTAPADPR